MFGTERMVAALNTGAEGSPEEILSAVKQAVDAFVGDAEQFDDLTMMCLTYKGAPSP
jgi:sigma-B regulation protein RsbU (phosphoserine phosphatase)